MLLSDTILGVFLISQFCVGATGNSLLFMMYVYTFIVKPYLKKPIDSILVHLTMVNTLSITFTLIPDIIAFSGVRSFLNDVGCQSVLYILRVTRGLSICTTCILSTFQAITITPNNSRWAWLKPKLSTWTFPSFLFIWVINLLLNAHIIQAVIAKANSTHVGHGYSHNYWQNRHFGNQHTSSYISVILIFDLLFVVLIMWTSFYMVTFLYRYHKRVQHIRSTNLSTHVSPEHKATHSILMLVSCFTFFYCLNNIATCYEIYAPVKIPRLTVINFILTTCYPTIYPFLLMKNNKIIWHFTSSPSVLRNTCIHSIIRG